MQLKIYAAARLLITLLLSVVVSTHVFSQVDLLSARDLSSVKVENLSDQEIRNLYQRATAAGYTEDELIMLAQDRGLPQSEVALLRRRIGDLNLLAPRLRSKDESSPPVTQRYDTTSGRIQTIAVPTDDTIFGSELFSSASMAFEPNLRIPAPPNYMLGPDDEIIISVYGYSENRYALTVDEQGEVYIPNVGPIVVSGLTLEEATDRIRNRLASTIYTAIRTGQTKVQVTLGKIRSIRVTVIGQAKRPGTYTVSSLTTLYNILYLCGGPTEMGSYRDIEVIRGSEKRTADLYDFLVYGNQKDNILLREGDVVRIPYYRRRVTLEGYVKRPGKYEMLEDETFSNLLEYSGGFTDNAYRGEVSVERITDSVRRIIDLRSPAFQTFQIKGSDRFFVKQLREEFGNRLFIVGAVQRPGPYELNAGMTLSDLISKAGGLTPDAFRSRALIYRYLPNKLPAIESVSLDSVFAGQQRMLLQKNDSVVIQSLFFFRDGGAIAVRGNVRNPTQLGWREGLTLKDALFSAGGIDESGDSTNIEVARRVVNAAVEQKDHPESRIFTVNLKSPSAFDIALQPSDIIIVKEKPGYTLQRVVSVAGEVLSPGAYVLERSGSRITDVIERAGGFRASADSGSLTIRRLRRDALTTDERQQLFSRILAADGDSLTKDETMQRELSKAYDLIAVDMAYITANPGSPENLLLENGDILTVERVINLVKVSGAVYFPTVVAYKPNKTLKYYVQQAGNFMPQARKTGALVINPNGKVESVGHFLFFKTYPKVSPRSEIFVPRKEKSNRARLGATEWAVIISAMGILSNVVINLTK